jgi:ketosteroid isomerase-like protein
MASADCELVSAAVAAWGRGDKAALLACFAPDFEFVLSGQILDQPLEIHGHNEYSQFFDTWLAAWDTFSFSSERVADVGRGRVLLRTNQHAVSREGLGVDRVVWFVADIADGVITRYQAFTDEPSALAAAGVEAWPSAAATP